MDSFNKREHDILTRIERMNAVMVDLNSGFQRNGIKAAFHFCTSMFVIKSVGEKRRTNKAENYTDPASPEEAMGTYVDLQFDNGTYKPFIFSFFVKTDDKTTGSFYMKLPAEGKKDPKGFIKKLAELDYQILLIAIDKETSEFTYAYTSVRQIKAGWKWHMSTSKGNTNRMQWSGNWSDLIFTKLEEKRGLIFPSILETLKELGK